MRSTFFVLALLFGCMATCWGDAIGVGYLVLTQDDSSGTTSFLLQNQTGFSEFAPDFPVTDLLDFSNVQLTVFCANAQCMSDLGGSSQVFGLGSVASGDVTFSVPFSVADQFSSALLTLDLGQTNLTLDDGMGGTVPFTGSNSISISFTPASGSFLAATDFSTGVIGDIGAVSDPEATVSAIPEPATFSLIAIGIGSMLVQSKRTSKRSARPSAKTLRYLN